MSSVPQQQQPVVVYPNTVTTQNKAQSTSNGSFGTVFIVLAVIVAISAIACFLGRLCNRKLHNKKPKPTHKQAIPQIHKFPDQHSQGDTEFGNQKAHDLENPNRIQPETQKVHAHHREEDVEYGFDQVRDHREGEFGQRVGGARIVGNGGMIRGVNFSENGVVNKFHGGDPRASVYDAHNEEKGFR